MRALSIHDGGRLIEVTDFLPARRRVKLVTQAKIQGQIRSDAYIVLHKFRNVPVARVILAIQMILKRELRNSKQEIG